jgi:hypothetical protein
MAALKEIRHSAHLPATLAHYAYEHQRARERKSLGRAALRPREVRTAGLQSCQTYLVRGKFDSPA